MRTLIVMVCILAVWSVAQAELGPPAKVLKAEQTGETVTIVIEGTTYDKLCRYTFPRLQNMADLGFQSKIIDNDEVAGKEESGNTKFLFKKDERVRCNFHKGDVWANLIEEPKGVLGIVRIIKKDGSEEPSLYIRDIANSKQTPELDVNAR